MNTEVDFEELAPWLLIPITLAAGILRVLYLDSKGMWLDETFSVWMAGHSAADILQWVVKIDQHPPLYYLLLHEWIGLTRHTDPYTVRIFSMLFGTAAVPVIYLIGKRISGVVMGLAAAVFLAFSLFNIFFGQETRMYTLLTFNAAVAIYALVRLLTDPRAVRPIGSQFLEYLRSKRSPAKDEPGGQDEAPDRYFWSGADFHRRASPFQAVETDLAWVAWIVFSAATLYSHNTAVLFLLAANIFVLGLMLFTRNAKSAPPSGFQPPSFANWVKAQLGILLLWSPWIVSFVRQAGAVDRRFWIPKPTWDAVVQTLKGFLYPSAPMQTDQAVLVWGLYVLVLCLGLVYFRKKFSQFLFLAALFAVPFLGELLVSLRRPIFFDRTLIWTTVPLFLILAAGITQLKFRPLVFLVLGGFVTLNLFAAGDYYRWYQKEDWSAAAGYVGYYAENDDLVLFNSNFVEIPFNYYFKPYEEKWRLHVDKQGLPLDLISDGVLEPEMTAADIPSLVSMLHGRDRVWLVYSHNAYTDPTGLIPETLASQMKLTRTREFNGGKVQLYQTD